MDLFLLHLYVTDQATSSSLVCIRTLQTRSYTRMTFPESQSHLNLFSYCEIILLLIKGNRLEVCTCPFFFLSCFHLQNPQRAREPLTNIEHQTSVNAHWQFLALLLCQHCTWVPWFSSQVWCDCLTVITSRCRSTHTHWYFHQDILFTLRQFHTSSSLPHFLT